MLESQYEFKIIKDHDVDAFKKDFDKVDSIKLDLKSNKLHKAKFLELFERLAVTRLNYVQIDLTNYDGLDSEKFEALVNCIRNWNPKTLILLLSGVKMSDTQFDSLMFESLRTMNSLENLYLDLQNTDFNKNKMKSLEKLLPKLESLNNIFLNLKSNNLHTEDITHISKEIQHIPAREFLF
jgi:hypothetical protein